MPEPHELGTITLDRLARGFKVTVALTLPGEAQPRRLSKPDHFPRYDLARAFADALQADLRLKLVDNVLEAANGD